MHVTFPDCFCFCCPSLYQCAPFSGDRNVSDYREGTANQTALFTFIKSVSQPNAETFVVTDDQNHCIRRVYRDGTTLPYLGKCGSRYGKALPPGVRLPPHLMTFLYPITILYDDVKNVYYVSSEGSSQIAAYDTNTKFGELLVSGRDIIPQVFNMIFSADKRHILANHAYGISRVELSTKTTTLLTGSIGEWQNYSYNHIIDGPMDSAAFNRM